MSWTEMIEELSSEQEKRIPEFVDKWLRVGLSCDPVTRDLVLPNLLRKKILKYKPVPTIYMDSPLAAWFCVCIFGDQVGNQVRNQVGNQVENQVWDQVGNQVWDQVGNQVWNQVENQVGNQVRNQVRNQVWNQVENQVWDQVENQVWDQVENQVWGFIYPYIDGNFSSGYFSFYDYMNHVLGIKFDEAFHLYKKTTQFGLFYPLENVTIISDRPCKIKMKNKLLHCDGGLAIEYRDGFGVWALNGVKVPQVVAETPAEKLDAKLVITEKNAEVRREIVRKIGIERVCLKLGGKSLDKSGDGVYELLTLDLQDGRVRPYLKMRNPSIQTWHLEGVSPEIKTVEQALNWRNQTEEKPIKLT